MPNGRVFVAGHRGLVGSSVMRLLERSGDMDPLTRTRAELDLRDQRAVRDFIAAEKPDAIVLAAAKVGGIHANNTQRWGFIYDNLAIEASVIGAAVESSIERLIFLGSSCVYPRLASQPMREDALLTGPFEPTNEPYAVAKLAGIKLVEAATAELGRSWVSLMPTNLYGPADNFDLTASHVIPGMIRKFHEAKVAAGVDPDSFVELWGHGSALREFMHVDDLARAVLLMLNNRVTGLYNVGSGTELAVRDLAALIASVVGYEGRIVWDKSALDGSPRKLLDSSRMHALGWNAEIPLAEGLSSTYQWYRSGSLGEVERGSLR